MSIPMFWVDTLNSWQGVAAYFAGWAVLLIVSIDVYARVLIRLAATKKVLRVAVGFVAYLAISCLLVFPLVGLAIVDGWQDRLRADAVFYVIFLVGYLCSVAPAVFLFYTRRIPELQSVGYFQPAQRGPGPANNG